MSTVSSETFGQRVRRIREKQGVRQVDLAARAGISWRHLIRIEQDRGGVTKPGTVARLAGALGVEASDLAGANEDDEEADPAVRQAFHLFVDLVGQINAKAVNPKPAALPSDGTRDGLQTTGG